MTLIPPEQTAAEPAVQTAEIIAFPVRRPAPPVVVAPQERLARALDLLNVAMIEQRAAMADWRNALVELKASTSSLGDSLVRYRGSLQSLGQGVDTLRTQAKLLGHWAEQTVPTQA